jgi:excisionase family DNA binding protein
MLDGMAYAVNDDRHDALALSIEDAARYVGVSEKTLTRAITAKQLRAVRVGRRLLIEPADLRAWFHALPVTVEREPERRGPGRPKGSRNRPKASE